MSQQILSNFTAKSNVEYLKKRIHSLISKDVNYKCKANIVNKMFNEWFNSYLDDQKIELERKYANYNEKKPVQFQRELCNINTRFLKYAIDSLNDINFVDGYHEYSYKITNPKKDNVYRMNDMQQVSFKPCGNAVDNLSEWSKNVRPLYTFRDDNHGDSGFYTRDKLNTDKNQGVGVDVYDFSEYNEYNHLDDLLGGKLISSMNSETPGFGREDEKSTIGLLHRVVNRRVGVGVGANNIRGVNIAATKRNYEMDIDETLNSTERRNAIYGYSL